MPRYPCFGVTVRLDKVLKMRTIGFFEQDKQVRQQRDQIKREYCREHGIRLIEIRYDEDIAQRLSQELNV